MRNSTDWVDLNKVFADFAGSYVMKALSSTVTLHPTRFGLALGPQICGLVLSPWSTMQSTMKKQKKTNKNALTLNG